MDAGRDVGFSLIETLVVTAIFSAVIVCVPPMLKWMKHQGVRHAVRQLQGDLQLARMTAICQKRICTVAFNTPGPNQYLNLQTHRIGDLGTNRGKVHFLKRGPDGGKMAKEVKYNRQGMHTTVVPANIFISDEDKSAIYRIRIMLPGGISVHRWNGDHWQ